MQGHEFDHGLSQSLMEDVLGSTLMIRESNPTHCIGGQYIGAKRGLTSIRCKLF